MPNSALEQEVFEYKAINGNLSIDEAKGIVECFVAAVGNKDSVGDIVVAGAFDASLRRRKPRVVWGHDWNQPIGKVLEIYEVRPNDPRLPAKMKAAGVGGLYARVQFNLKSERGREAFSNILFFGEDQEWSIGYKTLQADFDPARQANILKELELYEVSPVLHGANQLTATISVKSEKGAYGMGRMMMPMGGGMINENYDLEAEGEGEEEDEKEREDDDSIVIPGNMPYSRRAAMALSKRVGAPVRLRSLDKNMIIADVMGDEGRVMTYRLSYHFEDGKFMFGDMEAVKPTLVYLPVEGKAAEEDEVTSLRDSKWKTFDIGWAKKLQEEHPDIWGEGGNIKGNDQWRILTQIAEKGKATTQAEMNALKLREAWIARHHQDFRLPGVIAQIKWLAVGSRGEDYMKNLIREVIKKKNEKGYFSYDDLDFKEMGDADFGIGEFEDFSNEKAAPLDAIPQERFTGDVLRGYGPRRGNLERLLRYWRPIMRKPGGFRRCRVILADHPELYPLNNICAWLHHETTGLWPNEGCHHPGMKNCRRKLRGVTGGSVWSDSDFNDRMRLVRERTAGKMHSGMGAEGMDWDEDDMGKMGVDRDLLEAMSDGEVTDDDIEFANKVLMRFMEEEKGFMNYIMDDANWVHVGDDEEGIEKIHRWVQPNTGGGCGCGCGGNKSAFDDLLVKAGRVLSTANMQKLEQAIVLLNQVVEAGGDTPMDMEPSASIKVAANVDDLFDVKAYIDPIADYYGLDAQATEDGIKISSRQGIPTEARQAIKSAVTQFLSNK